MITLYLADPGPGIKFKESNITNDLNEIHFHKQSALPMQSSYFRRIFAKSITSIDQL